MTNQIDGYIATTALGRLRGQREGTVIAFRGVPFAAPPTGDLRFAPPAPALPWDGIKDATKDGAPPPQPGGGQAGNDALDEDCLTLTIWTPSADTRRRPVLIWIFGGAFMIGAGSSPLYDGRLIAERDVVVVNINYRLGALGYLFVPGIAPGNLGLRDQIAALRWVRDHIAAFGGDPDNITVAGQSAGAMSAAFAVAHGRKIARRLILQSPAFATELATHDEAAQTGQRLLRALDLAPDAPDLGERLRAMPVATILAAQNRVTNAMWRGDEGRVRRAFVPAALPPFASGGEGHLAATAAALVEDGVTVLIGTTRDDAAQFYLTDPHTWSMDEALFLRRVATILPGSPQTHLRAIRARRPGAELSKCFVDLVTDTQLRLSALELAGDISARGGTAYGYRFDWCGAGAKHGATHCVEIPFLFGSFDSWRVLPFLQGADDAELARMAALIRGTWLQFARHGDPNGAGVEGWQPYDARTRAIMHLDLPPRPGIAEPACYAPRERADVAHVIVIAQPGGPDVLRASDIELPPPGPGQVRVRQTAIGVNYHDIYVRSGLYQTLPLPGVPGIEAVGVVEALGTGVEGLRCGDRIGYVTGSYGAYASARNLDARLAIRLPITLSDAQSAASLMKALTVNMLIRQVRPLQSKDTILVHAAAGGVGQLLCNWARHLGATVIGTVGNAAKAEVARAAGADHVILYREQNVADAVAAITGGAGVAVVYDSIGADTFQASIDALDHGGHLVSYGQASGPVPPFSLGLLATRSLTVSRPVILHYLRTPQRLRAMADETLDAFAAGAIKPLNPITLPLARAAEAHRLLESRQSPGGVVLIPGL